MSGDDTPRSIVRDVMGPGRFRNKTLLRVAYLMECVYRGMPLTVESLMKQGEISRRTTYEYAKVIAFAKFLFSPESEIDLKEIPATNELGKPRKLKTTKKG